MPKSKSKEVSSEHSKTYEGVRNMSILQELFLEEYDRRRRQKEVYRNDLREHPKGSERYKQLKRSVRRADKDMRERSALLYCINDTGNKE